MIGKTEQKFRQDLLNKSAYLEQALKIAEQMQQAPSDTLFKWRRQMPDGRILVWDDIHPDSFIKGIHIIQRAIQDDLKLEYSPKFGAVLPKISYLNLLRRTFQEVFRSIRRIDLD